jgi:hypothetical protein
VWRPFFGFGGCIASAQKARRAVNRKTPPLLTDYRRNLHPDLGWTRQITHDTKYSTRAI